MFPRIYFGSNVLAINKIKNEFPDHSLIYDNNVTKIFSSYSKFFDTNNLYIHTNLNSEDYKNINDRADVLGSKHILLFEDDSFDGRLSLVSKAKKNNLIFDCSYPLVGDTNSLKRHINNYLFSKNCNINSETLQHLSEICPVLRIKSKQSGSKKEILSFDIDILFKELEKIISYTDKISLSDIANCSFNQEFDIFEFIEQLIERNNDYCLNHIEHLTSSMGEQGFLLVLLSQLNFYLVLSDCKQRKIYDVDEIIKLIELRDLLGKFLDEEYKNTSYVVKSQNPIRVKIELSKNRKYSPKQISNMIQFVVDTIVDLRTSGNPNHSIPILISKLTSV